MPMRSAGTGPQAAPTPEEVYAWRSRPAARKARCTISRSTSRRGIEGNSSSRSPQSGLSAWLCVASSEGDGEDEMSARKNDSQADEGERLRPLQHSGPLPGGEEVASSSFAGPTKSPQTLTDGVPPQAVLWSVPRSS